MLSAFRDRLSVPLRIKVVILVVAALVASLASYVYVGNRLIIDDKLSYIYDYNFSHLRVTSEVVERRVEGIIAAVRILTATANPDSETPVRHGPVNEKGEYYSRGVAPLATRQREALERLYAVSSKEQGFTAVQILRPESDQVFLPVASLGTDGVAERIRETLGWTPKAFRERPVLIGAVTDGYLPVGVATLDSRGEPVAAVALVGLKSGVFKDIPVEIKTEITDRAGTPLFTNLEGIIEPASLDRLEKTVISGGHDSGVQDWREGEREFLAGYKRLMGGKFLVISLIPSDEAFGAARTLVKRSVFLGASILLLVIGFALLFARGITQRLVEMWRATEKVSAGDFTVRVDASGGGRDEVAGLAASFNVMAERIEELVVSTAEKARMEQELQTAELVQETLMPAPSFRTSGVEINSFYDHATECGGDWWHYAEVDGKVYMWIADATGHGAPAALLTSAAKSAVTLIERLPPMSAGRTLELLNKAIYETSKSKLLMTMFLGILDKATGELTYSCASHEHPYLIRSSAGGKVTKKSFEVLNKAIGKHLGSAPDNTYKEGVTQMKPGDTLVLFTDGLTDLVNPEGSALGRSTFIRTLCDALSEEKADSEKICARVHTAAQEHRNGADLADDVTFLACKFEVPATGRAPRDESGVTAPKEAA